MKKIFEIVGFVSLICFSFFYTDKIATVIKNNDDLMKQIENMQEQYKVEPIDMTIKDNKVILGMSGSKINVKKSYQKMEQLNEFNDKLLVYDKIKPKNGINKVYDKYIISANKNKKEVALVFEANDKIKNILAILKDTKVTFFTDGTWFEKNNDMITELIKMGHTIGNLGYILDYSQNGVSWMNTIVTKIGGQKNTFCLNSDFNDESLKRCQLNNSYTVSPIIIKNSPYINIKENLVSGSIIYFEVNDTLLKELPLIIDLINTKDLKIVNLEQLIDE